MTGQAGTTVPDPEPAVADRSIAVLHVDDESEFLDITADALDRETERMDLTTVTSAAAALDRFADGDFDCVVSDYQMPGKDGLELLSAVRERDPQVPFILFTGKGNEEIASRAIAAGASSYLQKSGGLEQFTVLANRIRTHVERYRIERRANLLLAAIETTRDGVAIIGSDEQFQYVNDAYADAYGYDPSDLVGGGWDRLYPADEARRYEREIVPTLRERGHWTGECVALRSDGSTFRSTHSLSQLPHGGHVCVIHHGTVREE